MTKLVNHVKNNKGFFIVMIIGIIAYLIQLKYVVLYADDMVLGNVAKSGGLKGAFGYMRENYMTWGGGPTPFIAIVFLLVNFNVWKICSCIILALMVTMATKMIVYNNNTSKGLVAGIIWAFIFMLNIWISRETLYWFDGYLAYVLTTFQLLVYFYYSYAIVIMKKKIKKKDYILLPIVAFLSGYTGPQTAIMTAFIGLGFIIWRKFIQKERIEKILVISFVFGIIGCLVEVLAPGNSVRMEKGFPEFANYGIIGKMLYRSKSVYTDLFNNDSYGFAGLMSFLFIAFGIQSIISLNIVKDEKNKLINKIICIMSYFTVIYIVIQLIEALNILDNDWLNKIVRFDDLLIEYQNNTFRPSMLISYIIATCTLVCNILMSLYISIKKKNPLLVACTTMAIGSQIIMLMSPYSPARSFFLSVALLWIVIAYLMLLSKGMNVKIGYIIIACISILNWKYGVLSFICYTLYYKVFNGSKMEIYVITIILVVIALDNYSTVTQKYKENSVIYYRNIEVLENASDLNEGEVRIEAPKYELYGFSKLFGIDWIEDAIKDYFDINDNIRLVEESTL